MDKYTLESLNRVIEYMYEAEASHFEESDEDEKQNHIFNDVLLVSEKLKEILK